jgi:hypothetical protein
VDLLCDKATLDDLQEGYYFATKLSMPSSVVGSYFEAYSFKKGGKQKRLNQGIE